MPVTAAIVIGSEVMVRGKEDICGIAATMSSVRPTYLDLYESGVLAERAGILEKSLKRCRLCPRQCGADRTTERLGVCGVGAGPKVAAMSIHRWEEPPISGMRGSGTIFFSGCTLKCLFCQNYPISQMGVGRCLTVEELAQGMLSLQKDGAHNINLVTATHQIPAVVRALLLAVPLGLHIPIVYNTSGYERTETLRHLEGIVDVYLPDIKYAAASAGQFCSQVDDYVTHNRSALVEMWRQVGELKTDREGIAYRGLMVRHLVLPDRLSGTRDCLAFLAREMGPRVWVSLMDQYFPAYKALHVPPLNRKVTRQEYDDAFASLLECGLLNGFVQENDQEVCRQWEESHCSS